MFDPYEVPYNVPDIEDELQGPVQVPRPRRIFPRPVWIDNLRPDAFRNRFRLDRDIVAQLHDQLFFRLVPLNARRNVVSVWDQLLITLR